MTVASAANKVTLNGNGATTSWPFSFRIFDSSDLEIYKTDTSGVQTEITSNFSVVVNGESGGTVTYPSTGSPLASGETITIIRVTVRAQSVDFTSQGAFLPQNHEDADDRAMMILQELDEKIDRAFKLPTSDTSGTATELTTDVTGSAGGVLYIQAGVLKLSESANIDNLETLAGISGDITTVAANDANITTVANNLNGTDTIGTVAGSIANVNNVGNNISNVVAVDGNEANINAAVANATNINTVAGISANVTTVAGISADVTAVAADAADIGVVSSNIADVNTVAGISANVTTVATDSAAINTVATDLTGVDDIGTVATNISNVNAVGSNISDITNAVSQAAAGVQRNTYTGDNSTVTFVLPATPWDADVVFAYLDGVNQDNSEWSVSGSDITFNTAPGTGVNIELVVLTAGTVTAAQTSASNAAASEANAAASAASAAAAANEIGLVDTIAELKALAGGVNEAVEVKGHTTSGDGGGGLFIWDAADTTTDDNGVYIQPNAGGTGRWIRQYDGDISVRWFGAFSGGAAGALLTAFQAAVDLLSADGGKIIVPDGTYSNLVPASITFSNKALTWITLGDATLPADMPGVVVRQGVESLLETSFQANRNARVNYHYVVDDSDADTSTRHYVHHVSGFLPDDAIDSEAELRAYSFDLGTDTTDSKADIRGVKGRVYANGGSGNLRALYGTADAGSDATFDGTLTGVLGTVYPNGSNASEAVAIRGHVGNDGTAAFQAAGTGRTPASDTAAYAFMSRGGTGQPMMPTVAHYAAHGGAAGDMFIGFASETDYTVPNAPFRVRNSGTLKAAGFITQIYTIADDAVEVITPIVSSGMCMFNVENANQLWGGVMFRANASPLCVSMFTGPLVSVTTGALTGTTGTDGNLTISSHTDGNIYIENRTGASRSVIFFLVTSG